MALYNEILVGRYNRFLQKLFQMKGGAVAPQLAGDIQPSFTFFNGVENRILEGWNKFGLVMAPGPVVAQTNGVRLRNVASNNVIVVIEKILVEGDVAGVINLRFGALGNDLTNTARGQRFDARTNTQSASIISNMSNPGLAFGSVVLAVNSPVGVELDLISFEDEELPLLPGDVAQIDTIAVNTTTRVTFWWRERLLEESERA